MSGGNLRTEPKKKYNYSRRKPEGCIYPNCFECPYRDCVTDIIFPGETARNAKFSEIKDLLPNKSIRVKRGAR